MNLSCPSKVIVNEVTAKIKSANDMKHALDDTASQTHSNTSSWRGLVTRRLIPKSKKTGSSTRVPDSRGTPSFFKYDKNERYPKRSSKSSRNGGFSGLSMEEGSTELTKNTRNENMSKKSVTYRDREKDNDRAGGSSVLYCDRPPDDDEQIGQSIEIAVMWLALNEECSAMADPAVQRLYVAYTFLGRSGADMETPLSLPKPATYVDKCNFQFSKTFNLNECDLTLLGHMAKCRMANSATHDPRDCVVFTVISEPPEDPLGMASCKDLGYAYLYFGDLLEYSAGSDTYTEVIPVQSAEESDVVCGVLSIRVDGLDVVRYCSDLAMSGAEYSAS